MYSGKIAVPPGGGGILKDKFNKTSLEARIPDLKTSG
jgi:hypothetical protein